MQTEAPNNLPTEKHEWNDYVRAKTKRGKCEIEMRSHHQHGGELQTFF